MSIWGSFGSCPFRSKRFAELTNPGELWQPEHLYHRYQQSLFSTALNDDETTRRDRPSKKNNFGFCPTEVCRSNLQYRSFSGCGNNILSNTNFGRLSSPLKRLLVPEYEDGVGEPKSVSVVDKLTPLPNPRKISTVIHSGSGNNNKTSVNKDSKPHSLALMQWGQFLSHDLSSTAFSRVQDGSVADCRSCDSDRRTCLPIPVPENDPYFPSKDPETNTPRCLPFIRSQSVRSIHWQDQLNLVTSWMDSSHVYGSFKCQATHLRLHQGGRLKSLSHPLGPNFKSLLPRHATNHECKSPSKLCFNAGDDRVNEQPGLTSLHTLLVREHNRIASQLEFLNSDWNDEKIFQETRKIIVAINQHITFKEYLPRILGQDVMKLYKLSGDFQYDNDCDPAILNEFSTAAFRFGHTLIPAGYKMNGQSLVKLALNITDTDSAIRLRDHFNNPDIAITAMFVDELSRTIAGQPTSEYDNEITEEVRNHMNESVGQSHSGVDLAALNIQRGRDHGLPGYTKYKQFCSRDLLQKAGRLQTPLASQSTNFEGLSDTIDKETIAKLQQVYKDVGDIDLFTGGISERSAFGGLVGPTFGCIIAKQFEKLRKCDRFWYETEDTKIGFTSKQLEQIKKVTYSSLVCNNMDQAMEFQLNAFDLPNETSNPMIPCGKQPKMDMKFWAEKPKKFCNFHGQIAGLGESSRIGACTSCFCSKSNKDSICKSNLNTSCLKLIKEWGPEAVLVDKNCKNHCGHFFNITLSTN